MTATMNGRYRLHWSPTSPYVRKVMASAHELGIADHFDLRPTRPESVVADVAADNPLGRVPGLILPDGTVLIDSLVIAEYLDHAHGGSLFPPAGPARWQALKRHALAHGVIDAAIAIVSENRRPSSERSASFVAARESEIARTLDAFERDVPAGFDIGSLTLAVALGYVDFRLPTLGWRSGRAKLDAWEQAIATRPSLIVTKPRPESS